MIQMQPSYGALLLASMTLVAACEPATRPSPPLAATAVVRDVDETPPLPVAFVGVIVARDQVEVSFPVRARLARVAVRVGDRVEAGRVLAELDTAELDADIERADGAVREARAAHAQARVDLRAARGAARRSRALLAEGAISKNAARSATFAAQRARTAVARAAAATDQRRAELVKLRGLRTRTALRAPLAGRVSARGFDDGAAVPAGTAVVTLISQERDVRFAVPPDRSEQIAPTHEVRVRLGDRVWPATVSAVAPDVDVASQLVFAEAGFGALVDDLPSAGTRVDVELVAP